MNPTDSAAALLVNSSWTRAGIIVLLGLAAGLAIDLVLHRWVKRVAQQTHWQGDEIIVEHLAGKMPLWGALAGLAVAMSHLPLSAKAAAVLTSVTMVAFTVLVTRTLAALAGALVTVSAEPQAGKASTSIFRVLAKVGVWGLGAAIALHELGVSIAPLITALGVGGLAVALALQDTLSNLFAGLQILVAGQVKVGDFVRLESGEEGVVTDINWRNTTVRTLANNMVVVPNSKLASTVTVNMNQPDREMSVLVPVGVDYGSDLEKVERVTREVAEETQAQVEGAVREFKPVIRYTAFGDSAINFTVVLRAREATAQYLIKHEFIKRLAARYREEGITIPFPQRVVWLNRSEK